MVSPFVRTAGKFRTEIYLINLTVLIFLFRSTVPLMNYPFILTYSGLILYILIFHRSWLAKYFLEFIICFRLAIILFLILLVSFFLSRKVHILILKDSISSLILLSFYFFYIILVPSKKDLAVFLKSLICLVVFFALAVSVLGFLNVFDIIPYSEYSTSDSGIPIIYDNNFAILPVLFGLVAVFYLFSSSEQSKPHLVFYHLSLIIFSLRLLLSGSKRGIIVFAIIIIILTLFLIVRLFKKDFIFGPLSSNIKIYFLSFFIMAFGSYLFVSKVSYISKNNLLKTIGTKNIVDTKEKISSDLFKSLSLFYQNNSLEDFHKKLWSIKYDPKNPDHGWAGIGIHKTIFPLSGKNAGIVPTGSIGYMMDNSFNYSSWDGDSYAITLLGKNESGINEKLITSVYCYVSEDFNGSWVKLVLLYTKENEIHNEYDMTKKGTWQKLSISDECINSRPEARFYFAKMGVNDFSSLKGYVIIAYPQFQISDAKTGVRSYYIIPETSMNTVLYDNDSFKGITEEESLLSETLPVSVSFLKAESQKHLSYNSLALFTNFPYDQYQDPVRHLINKFSVEDTGYYPYRSIILLDSSKNIGVDDRIIHWQFAWQIFKNEYSWPKKLIGGGFDHLNWFGYYFLKDKTKSDWPHNPILSILLYSGILGFSVYIFFLYKVLYYFIKYIKEYSVLFIFFIISFFFSFFSGGGPFDPSSIGFFSVLPFFIHYVHKNEKSEPGLFSNN